MVQKITLERLVTTSSLSNIFERSLAMENIWKFYQNKIENNFCQTQYNTFTFFFYFLTGFLRNGLRKTFKFKLSTYFVNQDLFDLHIGQTHFLNSTNLMELSTLVGGAYSNLFINPLLYIRIGRYYLDRTTAISYASDLQNVLQNQTTLVNVFDETLSGLDGLFTALYRSLANYYQSITFSH